MVICAYQNAEVQMQNQRNKRSSFGFSLESPIHVAGFYEERVYIENLRDSKGMPLQIRRLGSNLSTETGHPIDVYEVESRRLFGTADTLYIDLYGTCDWRAPDGYTLLCGRPEREHSNPEEELGVSLQAMIQQLLSRKEG